jgi:hypothetical protein
MSKKLSRRVKIEPRLGMAGNLEFRFLYTTPRLRFRFLIGTVISPQVWKRWKSRSWSAAGRPIPVRRLSGGPAHPAVPGSPESHLEGTPNEQHLSTLHLDQSWLEGVGCCKVVFNDQDIMAAVQPDPLYLFNRFDTLVWGSSLAREVPSNASSGSFQ